MLKKKPHNLLLKKKPRKPQRRTLRRMPRKTPRRIPRRMPRRTQRLLRRMKRRMRSQWTKLLSRLTLPLSLMPLRTPSQLLQFNTPLSSQKRRNKNQLKFSHKTLWALWSKMKSLKLRTPLSKPPKTRTSENQMNVKNERNKENVAWFDYKNTG